MKKCRIFFHGLISIAMIISLAGCWQIKDINHRSLPVIMGISKEGDHFRVMLEIPIPTQGMRKQVTIKGRGKTISKALEDIRNNTEASLDLLHLRVLVFDKRMVKEGIREPISTFLRNRDVSNKTLVVYCDEDMDAFFESLNRNIKEKGTALYDFFEKYAGWTPKLPLTRLSDVYRSLQSYTEDILLPKVRSGESSTLEYKGAALLKNGKLVTTLNPKETFLVNAIHRQSVSGNIEVMNHANVMIVSNKVYTKARMKNGIPYLNVTIKYKIVVQEVKDKPSKTFINKELEDVLTARFYKLTKKSQAKQVDPLGLGNFFRSKLSYDELKRWKSHYYSLLKVNYEIKSEIQNIGNLKTTSE
ncbi:Ger(x)C family spore germination protein [Neobacillus piezotolerans]|uniref:Ger(X)C family spore germination protein n=1 Tax=Neobacillus piezotolerans TaxID=2259171 RepID=A0A3D8GRZ3_9BACI|nr:Ger(x)C family spore germination protein [Neobacillus piezotolerans]RDU37062.1 Ger(x)C family spore germination protein [Neobacillus piezotolerans]